MCLDQKLIDLNEYNFNVQILLTRTNKAFIWFSSQCKQNLCFQHRNVN